MATPTMESFFQGKRVLVTGAGRGIGKGTAQRLIELGANVIALSYSEDNLKALKDDVRNDKLFLLPVDLEDWDATRAGVVSVLPVDLLVNNAGLYSPDNLVGFKPETFDKIMNVNVKAAINVSQVVAEDWIRRKVPGSIVNISSAASQRAINDHLSYTVSKAALDGLTKMMAKELGSHNIRVNSLNPTVILTDMGRQGWSDEKKAAPMLARIPLRHFGEVDDAVNSILFLLSDHAKFVNGAFLALDGGLWVT